jgi:hypothetical protein
MGKKTEYIDDGFVPFVVDDDTGTVYVDPDGSELRMESDEEVVVPGGEQPPRQVREFIERETDLDPVHERKRWVEEYRLGVGDDVYVAGQVDPDGAPDGSVAVGDGARAPKFFVSDEPGHDLAAQVRTEALFRFLVAGVLFAFAAFLYFS